ncbi:phytoene dehydrogenase [Nannizzia gypsea CBS 118893]|uniref:Phytoene desaturase n=1 Tax=Arthroderma gypseum (strain ATCC MYA-4604 / CBS 118893) TaxID=535722 RepID=E4UPP5_ARTGP|nr:phytoene dehydrogenase [Nannizzia gypsea CBS 118893]EFQ99082.1 phytoene dehydrogenase [Nannizzia gypsea CBS 118893]
MKRRTAIIVGAGAGGVATAARLAKEGFEVTVVEKNSFIGGRCSLIQENGYRFDQGPSLLLLPKLFADTFKDLGTSMQDEGVQLLKCEPNYRIWFGDHDRVDMSTDMAKMKAEIERYEDEAGFDRYLSYMKESSRHHDLSMVHVLKKNFPRLFSMLRPEFLFSTLTLHPFESIYSRASRYFASEKMRRVFTFASMYLGMSPFDAPATYSLLQYSELADGIWYPTGGFQAVLEAVANIGKRSGVKYRLNEPVSSIQLSKDRRTAVGVKLSSGEILTADTVVINADLVYAYNELLPISPLAKTLKNRPASCSSISFFWSFDRVIPELQTHNIFLADEYQESFDSIFNDHKIPDDPSFYVNVPSRVDPSAAPPGKDAAVALVPVGHLVNDNTWADDMNSVVAETRERIIDTIESRTGARGLRDCIVSEKVDTPFTWREKFNLHQGAILGLSHSFFNVLSFRPKTKHDSINGLYFVGASTHPGTGVPICLAGSKIVCEQILEGFGIQKSGKGLQKIRGWTICGRLAMFVLFIFVWAIAFGFRNYS